MDWLTPDTGLQRDDLEIEDVGAGAQTVENAGVGRLVQVDAGDGGERALEDDVLGLLHEKTRPDKENDRTRHIIETRAQSGPVLLTYPRSAAVDAAVAAGLAAAPLYEFLAPDGI